MSLKTIRLIVISCILLGLTALIIGIALYSRQVYTATIESSFDIASHAAVSVTHSIDPMPLAKQVMDIYYSLTDEQREKMGTDEYRDYFASVEMEEGSIYARLTDILLGFFNDAAISDVYIAMYDAEHDALVYIVDPSYVDQFLPGEWEEVESTEIDKFLNWNGENTLYDISYTRAYGWISTAGVPVYDDDGNICFFVLSDVEIEGIMDSLVKFALPIAIAMLCASILIAWALSDAIKKNVVDPINAISKAADQYAKDKKAGLTTNRFAALDIHESKELENLCKTMASMEKTLIDHEQFLTKVAADKERIETELDMAKKIQFSMLPSKFPAFPERTDFDIFATMTPAREVGGDYYDFFFIDDDHLALVIADVSGKGIPAALFMMITKVIVQSCAMLGKGASDILTKTNEALCTNNKTEFFVTVWIGIVELSTGKVTATNAGHEYPALMQNGKFDILHDKHSIVVGGVPEAKYKEYTIDLKPGDKLFVYTDGVTEAENSENKFYGMERLTSALNDNADKTPEGVVEGIQKSLAKFTGNADQFDDITMLCFEYKGKKKK
jgi:sigma-B regulation protein RsbU (phosphoserine phosphatase)